MSGVNLVSLRLEQCCNIHLMLLEISMVYVMIVVYYLYCKELASQLYKYANTLSNDIVV